jgi:type VI secretion system secreted protein Hcp
MRPSGGKPVKYLTIELTDVTVSGVTPEASARDKTTGGKASAEVPTESVSFNYGTIKWTYTQQKRADGSKGGNVTGGGKRIDAGLKSRPIFDSFLE